MKKILLVDDDEDLSAIIKDMLVKYGYEVMLNTNCEQAYESLTREQFQLLLLDVNLPDGNGFEVCKEFRKVSKVPIIFASARTSEDDKIAGFNMGGDDYLSKPYSLKELLARVNALWRRTYGAEEEGAIYTIGSLKIDIGMRQVLKKGKEIKLSLKEFDLLSYLCAHPDQAITKEALLHEVWSAFSEAEISTVAVHIRWLREKLEDNPAEPKLIQTVWGVGYRFCTKMK